MERAGSYIKRAKDLAVYKRAYAVSLEVHRATLAFPKMEQYALADQMRRSSKGICANLAEGFAKQTHSKPEFARFISMAMGSCSEVETWISYAFDLEYITQAQRDEWLQSYAQFLNSSIRSFPRLGRVLAAFPPTVRAHCGPTAPRVLRDTQRTL